MRFAVRRSNAIMALSIFILMGSPVTAYAGETASSSGSDFFSYVVFGVVAFSAFFSIAVIQRALAGSTWSLSDALSEEANITPLDKDGKPIKDANGVPAQTVSELRASSSRLIALIGLIAILMLYLGFGLVTLKIYASTGTLPSDADLMPIIKFLLAGATLFAPYAVNKVSSIFDWTAPKKA